MAHWEGLDPGFGGHVAHHLILGKLAHASLWSQPEDDKRPLIVGIKADGNSPFCLTGLDLQLNFRVREGRHRHAKDIVPRVHISLFALVFRVEQPGRPAGAFREDLQSLPDPFTGVEDLQHEPSSLLVRWMGLILLGHRHARRQGQGNQEGDTGPGPGNAEFGDLHQTICSYIYTTLPLLINPRVVHSAGTGGL